ncbi:MAG: imidazole glycerol phosphate synthase subunit HisF [Bacteroidia bacterium]|nr:MAG: imidazole glycerol phosphate synthase subunit HisF [Bacteroidia bacterium]
MLTKRIIPCLDIKNGRTVKGVTFGNLQDAGDPVELAAKYSEEGADELCLLDITATLEGRTTFLQVVEEVAAAVSIPFTVGGGISDEKQVELLLSKGADKVSVNTAAIRDPQLITRLSNAFGNQCVVVAIDARHQDGQWQVVSHAGTRPTGILATEWAIEVCERGAGEILLTSFTADGTRRGFSLDITHSVSHSVNIPVIASGGAGKPEHFLDVFTVAKADAALAAGIFHYGVISIREVKAFLKKKNVFVR